MENESEKVERQKADLKKYIEVRVEEAK